MRIFGSTFPHAKMAASPNLISGGNEVPAVVGRSFEDEPGERTLGTGS